jgi:hypothetical protein
MTRRALMGSGLGVLVSLIAPRVGLAQALATQPVLVEVWKSPSCGCCADWVTHLESNGFKVVVNDVGNNAARVRLRVPARLGSCHTALVGRYPIEVHVPAADIHRLLRDRPDAIGLAVPGMPLGSPGMDGPAYDNRQDPYDVLLIHRDGSTRVFSSYFQTKRQS